MRIIFTIKTHFLFLIIHTLLNFNNIEFFKRKILYIKKIMKILSFIFISEALFPIISGIFYVIRSYSFSFIPNNEYQCSLFFEIVLLEFGMFLSFILEFINISRQRGRKTDSKVNASNGYQNIKNSKYYYQFFYVVSLTT